MYGGFDMSHGALELSGSHVSDHGEQYAAALERLRERANGAAAWGDSGEFQSLTSAYSECTLTALEAFTQLSDVVQATGTAMTTASRRVSYTEEEMARGTRKFEGESGVSWA